MTRPEPPEPITVTDVYLAGIYDRLGKILDRLPAAAQAREDGTVELREPVPPSPAAEKGPGVSGRPARAARTSARTKTTSKKAR